MQERKPIFREYAPLYQKGSKKEKNKILDNVAKLIRCHRKHIARVLRNHGKKIYLNNKIVLIGDVREKIKRPKRPIIYDNDVKKALKFIWYYCDCINSKRLQKAIPERINKIYQFNEYQLTDEVEKKLLKISHGTIENLLRTEKKKINIKGISHTKPGNLLKNQIPIVTHEEWKDKEPGYLQIDLVGHDGGDPRGDFCFTLNTTDINTCWTDFEAIQNKAYIWTKQAIHHVRLRVPFDVKGLHPDSGSEFINYHLKKYCNDNSIELARSRSYKKNDNCYIEEKNGSIIRRAVFYYRYDTQEELDLLNDLYGDLRLYINFFQPSTKLIEKIKIGSKVKKKYDEPKTPYQRVLDSETVSKENKKMIKRIYKKINPFELKRNISKIQDKLIKLQIKKNKLKEEKNIFGKNL